MTVHLKTGINVVMLAAMGVVLAACGPVDRGVQPPEPAEPPDGPVVDSIVYGATTFTLYDEGGDCLAVEIEHPEVRRTVERRCFDVGNVLTQTSSCGWLLERETASGDADQACDIDLPSAFYGVADPDSIGFVCVGVFDFESSDTTDADAGVVGARLLDRDARGRIFDVVRDGEGAPAHLLDPAGLRMGEPPLDAPSGPIYRYCEQLAHQQRIQDVTTSTAVPPTTTSIAASDVDPWAIDVVDDEDYESWTANDAVEMMVGAEGVIEATIATLGNQSEGGRWCCENPPFTVADIDVIAGQPLLRGDDLNGLHHQQLPEYVEPGDRVTMLIAYGAAQFVFGADGGLVHPVPEGSADAIDLLRQQEAAWRGYASGVEISPLDAVKSTFERYEDDWWGSQTQRAALALSGVTDFPETCSAGDLDASLEPVTDPRSYEGLPAAVAATRRHLLDAAVACDYDALLAEAPVSRDPNYGFDEFWWGATANRETFVHSDRVNGHLRKLTLALLTLPYGTVEGSETTYFTWPTDFDEFDGSTSFADTVSLDDLDWLAAVNNVERDDLVAMVDSFGGYALFRVGIAEDGTWLFALAGD